MTEPDDRRLEHDGTPPGRKRVVMVAAVAENGVIGHDGGMPWHLPGELAHFRRTTTGHSVVMGRVTYEGIGRPLPNRTNIVVTRQPGWSAEGILVAHSVEAAIRLADGLDGDIVIGGGTQIYADAMRFATHQVLTEVHQSPEGDTYYPHWDRAQWTETRREEGEGYSVVRYTRDSLRP